MSQTFLPRKGQSIYFFLDPIPHSEALLLQHQKDVPRRALERMEKSKLVAMLKRLLGGKENVDFLLKLEEAELKKLLALIREKVGAKSS
jgi:hypothetical protein